jgi:plasmid stabilization system protein ParE
LARAIAQELIEKVSILRERPYLGRPLAGHDDYRQIVLQAGRAAYVVQYRIDEDRLVIVRVFHGRESRP